MAGESLRRHRKGGDGGEQNYQETGSNRQVLETSGETMDGCATLVGKHGAGGDDYRIQEAERQTWHL